jgi:glycine/D-amino acid oxidase-like deaminating enzyme
MLLPGFNGHGVALSACLGQWATQALLSRRSPLSLALADFCSAQFIAWYFMNSTGT